MKKTCICIIVSCFTIAGMMVFAQAEEQLQKTERTLQTIEQQDKTDKENENMQNDKATVPDEFKVRFECSHGDFVVQFNREWAPNGVDRIHELVSQGFFDGARFFRVIEGFVAQFGLHADPSVNQRMRNANIKDDPVKASNTLGRVTFAQTNQPNSRTTQLFINFGDNSRLDDMRFAPVGEIIEGLDIAMAINSQYGERPDQGRIQMEGNSYLDREFPDLDFIKRTVILDDEQESKE